MQNAQINSLIREIKSNKEGKIISFYKGKRIEITFSSLYPMLMNASSFLQKRGYNTHANIGILGKNNLEWVIADFACIYSGIKLIPLELNADITYLQENNLNLACILVDKDYMNESDKFRLYGLNCICLNELIDEEIDDVDLKEYHQYAPEDVISYKMTSGSTGKPKIIGHSIQAIQNTINGVQDLFKHDHHDRLLLFLPLNLLQQRYWLYSAVFFKFTVIIVPKEYFLIALKTEKPTVLMGVPYIYELLYKDFKSTMSKNKQLLHDYEQFITLDAAKGIRFAPFVDYLGGQINYLWTGSAPISEEILQFYFSMNVPLYQGYGMNETCIIAKNYPGNNKTGSVGKIFSNIEIGFDENNQIIAKNKYPVCHSYVAASDEDQQQTFLKDGNVATGDVGYLDGDGYLFITGRVKEMIALSSSKKIIPRNVEEKIALSPEIKYCIIYGDNRPYLTALIIPETKEILYPEIELLIEKYNAESSPEECVYRFFVLYDDFSEENHLLSSQNKIKRKNIYEKYQTQFEVMYS